MQLELKIVTDIFLVVASGVPIPWQSIIMWELITFVFLLLFNIDLSHSITSYPILL